MALPLLCRHPVFPSTNSEPLATAHFSTVLLQRGCRAHLRLSTQRLALGSRSWNFSPQPSWIGHIRAEEAPTKRKGTRMSTAQLVVQHLPYLRRYARALTGSQMAGDAYVAATLETLVSEPETIGAGGNVKVELFEVFTRIWNSLSVNGRGEQVQRDLPAEVRIGQITPLPRQAFLLSCLEGFSEEEVGDDPVGRYRRRSANSWTRRGASSQPTWRPTS